MGNRIRKLARRAFSKKVLNAITVLKINGDSVSNFGVRDSVVTNLMQMSKELTENAISFNS